VEMVILSEQIKISDFAQRGLSAWRRRTSLERYNRGQHIIDVHNENHSCKSCSSGSSITVGCFSKPRIFEFDIDPD